AACAFSCKSRSRRFRASSHPAARGQARRTAPAPRRSRRPVRLEPDTRPATASRAENRCSRECRQRRVWNAAPEFPSCLSLLRILQNVTDGFHVEGLSQSLDLAIDRLTVGVIVQSHFGPRDELLHVAAHREII